MMNTSNIMGTMNTLYDQMLAAADPSQVAGLSRFFKCGPGQYGEGDKFLGIKVPVTREIVRRSWRDLLLTPDGEPADPFPELERCICSEYHEIRLATLLTLVEIFSHAGKPQRRSALGCDDACRSDETLRAQAGHTDETLRAQACRSDETLRTHASRSDETFRTHASRSDETLRARCIDFYLAHTDRINNWDLVDLSCYPLLGEWLLPQEDRSILYRLAKDGNTLWEQRIGIVTTMTFIRHGQLSDTFAIADILLHHRHDLIHKAVGWLLREAGKRDRNALESYLQGLPDLCHAELREAYPQGLPDLCHAELREAYLQGSSDLCHAERREASAPRYLQMPRTMLRYAIERFPEPLRQHYLKDQIRPDYQ